jgi:hypothetical protein
MAPARMIAVHGATGADRGADHLGAARRGLRANAALEPIFLCFFATLIMWPNYLAIALPSLPVVTLLRVFVVPLIAVFLICLSVVAEVPQEAGRRARGRSLHLEDAAGLRLPADGFAGALQRHRHVV